MKNIKKIIAIVLIMASLFTLAACGKKKEASDVPVYKVLTEATFPPFDTVDEDGNIIGFDMDLITAIGEDQGFKVEFIDMSFDALIPALQAGNGDIIAAGMWSGDPERREKIDFTEDYYIGGSVLLVAAGNDSIKGYDDLTPEHVVVSQIATNYADDITALAEQGIIKEAVIMDRFDTCVLQVANGDVDALWTGYTTAQAYMNANPDKVKIAGEIMTAEPCGFAVKKGNTELLNQINEGLANMRENGTYDELVAKWFDVE